jgi:hypothetical protein
MGYGITVNTSRSVAQQGGKPQRWIIPIGGGLLAAVLAVIGTPHVAWYLRAALAVIAFVYIAGQSAAYLWSSDADQG